MADGYEGVIRVSDITTGKQLSTVVLLTPTQKITEITCHHQS